MPAACPSCHARLTVPPSLAGCRVACSKCGTQFAAPGDGPPQPAGVNMPCPTCRANILVPESGLCHWTQCPVCGAGFAAVRKESYTASRSHGPAYSDPGYSAPERAYGGSAVAEDWEEGPSTLPGKLTAAGILLICGAGLGIFGALVLLLWWIGFCWPFTYVAFVGGILGIIDGCRVLSGGPWSMRAPKAGPITLLVGVAGNLNLLALPCVIVAMVFLYDRSTRWFLE